MAVGSSPDCDRTCSRTAAVAATQGCHAGTNEAVHLTTPHDTEEILLKAKN